MTGSVGGGGPSALRPEVCSLPRGLVDARSRRLCDGPPRAAREIASPEGAHARGGRRQAARRARILAPLRIRRALLLPGRAAPQLRQRGSLREESSQLIAAPPREQRRIQQQEPSRNTQLSSTVARHPLCKSSPRNASDQVSIVRVRSGPPRPCLQGRIDQLTNCAATREIRDVMHVLGPQPLRIRRARSPGADLLSKTSSNVRGAIA